MSDDAAMAHGADTPADEELAQGSARRTARSRFVPDSLLAIAVREFRIVARSRWPLGVAVLFGVFTAAVVGMGALEVGPSRYDAVAASLAELGVYLVPLVALTFGYDAVVGPATTGTLELLFALPVSQGRVVIGTYLGRASSLAAALLLGFVPGAALTVVLADLASLGVYAVVALAAVATALAFLGISLLVSAVAHEKTHALGAVLLAWLWFVLLHDLLALGAIAALDLSGTAVGVMVLLNPADCFRVLALSRLEVVSGGVGSVLQAANLSVPLVVLALAVWTIGTVWLAARLVRRRRL